MSYLVFDDFYDTTTELDCDIEYYEHSVDLGDAGSHEFSVCMETLIGDACFSMTVNEVSVSIELIAERVKMEAELYALMKALLSEYGEDAMLITLAEVSEEEDE